MTLVLATSSSFRRRLFEKHFQQYIQEPHGEFEQFISPDIDEKSIRHPDPTVLCRKIAEAKCDAVLHEHKDKLPSDAIVLTFDQVVVCDGQLREKPQDEKEARAFLKSYSDGEPAIAYSGVLAHNVSTGERNVVLDKVTVKFSEFPDSVVDHLIEEGEIFLASGSFTVEDRELGKYVETMDGTLDAIEGLPIAAIQNVIKSVCEEYHFPPEKPLATITHVIFDMDGLLLDTESMYSVAQQKMLDPYGIKFTYEVKSMMMGKKAIEAVEIMLKHYNLDLDPGKFTKDRENLLDQMFPKCDLMPGVLRLLKHLKAHGVPMAIATSSHRKHYSAKTTKHKELFDSVFSHVITGDEVTKSKPDPEIFLSAMEKFGEDVDPGKVLVFEDAPLGVEAAMRAGMHVTFAMTICRYWQQGTCTFGSSCRFEHIGRNPGAVFSGGGSSQGQDIVSTLVTTVKQDVEQSSKGKQWLFSCYSPAKDCASIPGIDDISPEEMRHDAYTAKVEGSSAQYQQKYQELQQAYNQKRQALANPSNELKEVYRKIYNKENLAGLPTNLFDSSKQSVFGGGSGSNPFGGTQQSSSVFGGQTNSASTGLFGGQQSSSTTSLFGAQPATNSIIFGGQSSTNTSSVFGGQQASTATNSVFGGSSSLFGGQQSASGSSGLFGGGAAQQQQSKSVFGGAPAFGSPNATGSVFGQTQAAQSTFGAPSAFGAPQNQGSSIFGGTSAFSTPTSTPSMFGGQTNLSAQPNNFGQPQASVFAQQQPPVSSAASGSIFGQQLQPQNTTSTFGQSAAQPPQPQGSSVFGAPQQATPASNIFSAATSISLFGQQPDQHTQVASVFGNQPQAASVFGNQPQAASVFGNQPQQPQAAPFAQAQNQPFPSGQPTSQNEPATKLGSNPFAKPSGGGATGMFGKKVEDQLDSSIYSLLESLTAQDLEAFKAPSFSLGLIPERPPPRELCVA